MRIRLKWWKIKVNESGYQHIILLAFSRGLDGILIQLPFCRVEITWGDALLKQKEEERLKVNGSSVEDKQ
jgi:hypothetical protein